MRAHYYSPTQDNAGNLLPDVQVSVFQPGTTNLITDTLYADDSSNTVLSNPYVFANGVISFYLDNPQRVRIGIVQGNLPIQYIEDQDVIESGSDSPHTGVGSNSTTVGLSTTSTGDSSVSMGYNSSSAGSSSTALGPSASAGGNQSTAVGGGAIASGVTTTSVGYNAQSTGNQATAVGTGATSGNNHSTAVGAGATTDADNQVMLGTSSDSVVVPGSFVIEGPGGTRWIISVDATGDLITTQDI